MKANGCKSKLDHFIVSENLLSSLTTYSVLHEGDNLSDHSVVRMVLDLSFVSYCAEQEAALRANRFNWQTASCQDTEKYKAYLDKYLDKLILPESILECNNLNCFDARHVKDVEHFHNDIVDACLKASDSLSSNVSSKTKLVPGWHEVV